MLCHLLAPMLLLISASCLCANVWHAPLYSDDLINEVTIYADFGHGVVDSVKIEIVRGRIPKQCKSAPLPCRVDEVYRSESHVGSSCSLLLDDLSRGELVTYTVTGYKGLIPEIVEKVTFGVGAPTAEMATPLLWHGEADGSNLVAKFDVGLFIAESMSVDELPDDQSRDVNKAAAETLLNLAGFGKLFTSRRQSFNLWLAPFGTSVKEFYHGSCSPIFYGLSEFFGLMDVAVVLHEMSCYRGHQGGRGAVLLDSLEGWILTHEIGHVLFEFGDEYEGNGFYGCGPQCPNLFDGSDCGGLCPAPLKCDTISSASKFRCHDSKHEIMALTTYQADADWGEYASKCIGERLDDCEDGDCYLCCKKNNPQPEGLSVPLSPVGSNVWTPLFKPTTFSIEGRVETAGTLLVSFHDWDWRREKLDRERNLSVTVASYPGDAFCGDCVRASGEGPPLLKAKLLGPFGNLVRKVSITAPSPIQLERGSFAQDVHSFIVPITFDETISELVLVDMDGHEVRQSIGDEVAEVCSGRSDAWCSRVK